MKSWQNVCIKRQPKRDQDKRDLLQQMPEVKDACGRVVAIFYFILALTNPLFTLKLVHLLILQLAITT